MIDPARVQVYSDSYVQRLSAALQPSRIPCTVEESAGAILALGSLFARVALQGNGIDPSGDNVAQLAERLMQTVETYCEGRDDNK